MTSRSDAWPGFAAAFWFVAAVTAFRIAMLALARTDLWVDEAQYWFWGQHPDFGYFSKPPLIGWVIRAFTEVLGDSAFAIRLPGPLFHAATALILGLLAQERFGGRAGLWTAVGYVTLPMTALGSLLISTDTILAPFLAAGLLSWSRLAESGRTIHAVLAGCFVGLAFLAKYAGLYFWPGAALAALFVPSWRVRPEAAAVAFGAFAVVIAPNIVWNLSHDLTTVEHTMDNAGWLRSGITLNLAGAAGFVGTQLAVFGPVLFPLLLALPFLRPGADRAALLAFALPVIALVTVQALVSRAYGNWAVTAYFAGAVAVLPCLAMRARGVFWLSVAVNGLLCVAVPLAAIFPATLERPSGRPYLERYLGRADVARQALELAERAGAGAVVADDRGLLANLAHEGRNVGMAIRALPPEGAPPSYYHQTFPWHPGSADVVLFVTRDAAPLCPEDTVTALATAGTAWARQPLFAHRLPAGCHDAIR